MYHTVATNALDQYTHRLLCCDMETTREPDIYVIQRVLFGDKQSGAIETVALRKTAEIGHCKTQNADCRLQTRGKMQTEDKIKY